MVDGRDSCQLKREEGRIMEFPSPSLHIRTKGKERADPTGAMEVF